MKKVMSMMLAFVLVMAAVISLPSTSSAAGAPQAIQVYIDGERLQTDQAPQVKNGRVMLPMRAVLEAVGAEVVWDQQAGRVTATRAGTEVVLTTGSKTAYVDGMAVQLDVAAQTVGGRTLVPVRFASEQLGLDVQWNAKSQSVHIVTESASVPAGWVKYENADLNLRMYMPSDWKYEVYEEKSAGSTLLAFNDVRKSDNIGTYLSVIVQNRADYLESLDEPMEGITTYQAIIDNPYHDVVYWIGVNNALFTSEADMQEHLGLVKQVYQTLSLLDSQKVISFPLNGK